MVNSRAKLPDIIAGHTYGRLTAIEKLVEKVSNGDSYWLCRCECGIEKRFAQHALKTGHTRSCGCLSREQRIKHGQVNNPTYKSWENMVGRCHNPNATGYALYGGRGIQVCDEWRTFTNFMRDMGERPIGKTIDRIDPNGNYTKGNCKWSTYKEQANNMRRNRKVIYNDVSYTLAQLSELSGIGYKTLQQRLDKGWCAYDAIHIPLKMVGWRVKRFKEQHGSK